MRNIEIKARVNDSKCLLDKIKSLTQTKSEIIKQTDIFFKVQSGRLKLRTFENKDAELIYYERPNVEGPKLCSFQKCDLKTENEYGLTNVLISALGIKGTVKKERHLYIIGQTRVHLDQVENLGNFMELEVVMTEDQTVEDGTAIANELMEKLNISKEDLVDKAYVDLLLE